MKTVTALYSEANCVQGVEQADDGRPGSHVVREDVETGARICAKFYWSVKCKRLSVLSQLFHSCGFVQAVCFSAFTSDPT